MKVQGQRDMEVGLDLGLEFILSSQGTSPGHRRNLRRNQEWQGPGDSEVLYQFASQC